jgi:hypothetical protein
MSLSSLYYDSSLPYVRTLFFIRHNKRKREYKISDSQRNKKTLDNFFSDSHNLLVDHGILDNISYTTWTSVSQIFLSTAIINRVLEYKLDWEVGLWPLGDSVSYVR